MSVSHSGKLEYIVGVVGSPSLLLYTLTEQIKCCYIVRVMCSKVLEKYKKKIKKMTKMISRAMAVSASLQEECFLDQFADGAPLQARFKN